MIIFFCFVKFNTCKLKKSQNPVQNNPLLKKLKRKWKWQAIPKKEEGRYSYQPFNQPKPKLNQKPT